MQLWRSKLFCRFFYPAVMKEAKEVFKYQIRKFVFSVLVVSFMVLNKSWGQAQQRV